MLDMFNFIHVQQANNNVHTVEINEIQAKIKYNENKN